MTIDLTFLRSKVAQRIFLLFVLCALLPIGALAIVSFTLVTRQLNSESQDRLSQESKAYGMSVYERLRFVEAEMRIIGVNPGAVRAMSEAFPQDLEERFSGLALAAEDSALQPMLGDIREFPDLTDAQWEHLDGGKSVVSTLPSTDAVRRVFMLRLVDPEERTKGILVGEISPAYLWGQDTLPASTELSVVGETGDLLVSSPTAPLRLHERVTDRSRRSASGRFEWNDGRERYLSSYWSLFLKPTFLVPEWTIVLSESRADALAATANFKAMFPLIIVMSVSVVLLLSLTQIRKHLVPLEKLREGTDRIARKDFTSRVLVTSGDEFEDLAKSFNVMAARLGQQFNALKTLNKIDSAILSTLETEEIVRTVLSQMRTLIRCTGVSVHLFDFDDPRKARTYLEGIDGDSDLVIETTTLTDEEAEELRDNPESLPIVLKEELSGIICLGYVALRGLSQEDVQQVRQVADQVAVALSNARLIERAGPAQLGRPQGTGQGDRREVPLDVWPLGARDRNGLKDRSSDEPLRQGAGHPASRRVTARHQQDWHPRVDSGQAGAADRGGVPDDARPRPDRGPHPRTDCCLRGYDPDRLGASRVVQRQGVPGGPRRRADQPGWSYLCRRRCLRRRLVGQALPVGYNPPESGRCHH